tara:strand:+ start:154 stop:474 length:321 start_codon:yes stop_codon:yes gene_type:complete
MSIDWKEETDQPISNLMNSWRKAIDKIAEEHNRSYPNVTQEDDGIVYDYSQMDTLPTVEQVLESFNMDMSEYSMLNPNCKVLRCAISEEDGNFVAHICLDKEDKSG